MEVKVYELELISKLEEVVPVRKFTSLQSGITVYLAEVEGPLVHGIFTLATEAHDDDGLPHTLEHLIFLGSEDYPYKGVLDLVANRCLASGTNAWTATDHTSYTISTAGSEGFLKFLPLYLDHILYPTITESGFVTEVHHVNGKGEDGGVVYCEMQGVENTGPQMVCNAFVKAMFPDPSGYRSNTGGALKNLQESTTYQKCRDFHQSFYRPENICLIVIGKVDADEFFEALKPVENKINLKACRDDFVRPWQSPIAPLTEPVEVKVEFPSDDEESGLVQIGWRAPPRDDITSIVALKIMMIYLQDTSISPMQKEFIEIEDPLCSQIDDDDEMFMLGYLAFVFQNVPMHHLDELRQKLFELIQRICSGEMPIDENRLLDVIRRRIWSIYSKLENEPREIITDYLICDFVYGNGTNELEEVINRVRVLESLKSKQVGWWLQLLRKFCLETFYVTVIGVPSVKKKEKLVEEEKLRVKKQKEKFGEDGLKKLDEVIENAVKTNEIAPPESMISSFIVPDIGQICFHPILRTSNHSLLAPDENQLFPLGSYPFPVQLDDIRSKFATIYGIMDTTIIPQHLKMFLPLFMELILESPIVRNGEIIPQEQVMAELSRDTVQFDSSIGTPMKYGNRFECGSYAQMAFLVLQVDIEHYVEGITWLHDLLFAAKMSPERVKIVAKKMLSDVSKLKREGYFMSKILAFEQCFSKDSNYRVNSLARQHVFLTMLVAKLADEPQTIINALEELQRILTSLENLTVHLAVDVLALSLFYNENKDLLWKAKFPTDKKRNGDWIWKQNSEPIDFEKRKLVVHHCHEFCIDPTGNCVRNAVLGLGSIESSFLQLSAPCLTDHLHPDLPAIMVLLEYMCQLEGPLWKNLRGFGLSYSYSISVNCNRGRISAMLYRSTDVVVAFNKLVEIMQNHLNGVEKWNSSLLESARSSLLYLLIREVDTFARLTIKSIRLHFDCLDYQYHRKLLKAVSSVTIEDLNLVGSKYVSSLFDTSKSFLSVCCNSSKVESIQQGFKVKSRELLACRLDGSFMDFLDENDKSAFPASKAPKESTCGYASCPTGKEGYLNVHLIPHTHDDVGWLKTPDEYFYGDRNDIQKAGVQYIIDTVIEELSVNSDRRFIYVETSFFRRWWTSRSNADRERVRTMVESGRLEFVGGSWSMNDEAAVHYVETIDHSTWGFRFLNDTLGPCAAPRAGWQIDPFGHSREQASLFAQMGFDGLFLGRIDFQDRGARLANKTLEMVWNASASIDSTLFTVVFSNHYSPPSGFCYDINCSDEPIKDNPNLKDYNVDEIVDKFLGECQSQAGKFATNNVLFTMGDDFNYQSARHWFINLDKLIYHTNLRQDKGSKVNVFYSTPTCYLQALHSTNSTWTVKSDDFFPYASDSNSYWTGYFTSRPTFKGYTKVTNNVLQVGKQLAVYSNTSDENDDYLTTLRMFQGDAQHHDAITGTEKQAVTFDYTQSLDYAVSQVQIVISSSLNKLITLGSSESLNHEYCPYLNISYCGATENSTSFAVTVYNTLEKKRSTYVRVPVTGNGYDVYDSEGKLITNQLINIPTEVITHPDKRGPAQFDLVFPVNLPASGFATYFVQATTGKDNQWKDTVSNPIPKADLVLTNGLISVTIAETTGLMSKITDETTSTSYNVKQNFYYYNAATDGRCSGAYVFRPVGSDASPVTTDLVNSTIVTTSNGVQEIHQTFSDYVSQVIRLKDGEKYVELEWLIGPIPLDGFTGKEVISRYETSFLTNGAFYTDSNGREVLQRIRNYRPTWNVNLQEPVSGNYYPINTKIFIQDKTNDLQLTVVTDRSHGGSSLTDGVVELMLHRRLTRDDGFGVGEALNELGSDNEGLRVRGKHRLYLTNVNDAPSYHRPAAIETSNEPLLFISPLTVTVPEYLTQYRSTYSGIAGVFPENVRLLTLEPWKDGKVLLRLEHFYEKSDDPSRLSLPVTVNVQNIFTDFIITSLTETTLGANIWLQDLNRFTWNTTQGSTSAKPHTGSKPTAGPFDIELQPMQIRTFLAEITPR
ncbi:hypothetical protein CHUAL_009562 [Chamberlinius hualienensis]